MREFIKSFFSFGFATTVEKLIAFLLLPLYTRVFSKVEFGVIDLIQVTLGISSIFAVLQLETAFQRYYYEYEGRLKRVYISSIFFIIVALSIAVAITLSFLSQPISQIFFETDEYSYIIKIASLQLPFTNFSMLGFVLLRYEKENVRFVLLLLGKVILTLLFILLFVVWQNMGIVGVFYAQLIAASISAFLLYLSIRHFIELSISSTYLKKSFKYALPQFPARIGSVLMSYANRFFMIGYLTIAAIGVYSLSLKLASSVQLVYSAFIMAWAPFMFQQIKSPGHRELFPKVLTLVAAPVFLLVSFVSLFSKEIVLFIASEEFFESYKYIGGLSLYFSLFIFKEVVDIGPKYTEKTKYLSYTFFCSLAVNLVTLYLFIPGYGLNGVVYSMLISNTFLLIMSWSVSNHLHFIPFRIIKFLILAIPAYLLAVSSMFVSPSIRIRLVVLVILICCYGFSSFSAYRMFSHNGGMSNSQLR
ncbi:lipopolysaccharide biosynthesis protein [Lunatimonas salinarum]|uniref:lipopolysaccharide biosynthesis protein n=1 Tax=Lunatimonas salinarum TaxID=1774590 RepID=UPI001ADF2574|nr:oligosaccharide flippase family protein [Lunatimonas salinarum]